MTIIQLIRSLDDIKQKLTNPPAGEYLTSPEERPFVVEPVYCSCACSPLPQRDADDPRHITCCKCGKRIR